jgi:hypothetical protein
MRGSPTRVVWERWEGFLNGELKAKSSVWLSNFSTFLDSKVFGGRFRMKLIIMTSVFLAGVYFGFSANSDGEVAHFIGQIETLAQGEVEWEE